MRRRLFVNMFIYARIDALDLTKAILFGFSTGSGEVARYRPGHPAAEAEDAGLVKGAALNVYPGAPHRITDTPKEQLNADLLAFVRS